MRSGIACLLFPVPLSVSSVISVVKKRKDKTMYSKPKLLQGVFAFEGQGLTVPAPLDALLDYAVPEGKRAQLIYFRAGNSTDHMIYVLLMRDGKPMRYFPLGAKADTHVALAVVEDMLTGTTLETYIAAPEGVSGHVVLDIGLQEI